jgi:hypothetical protein
MQVYWDHAMEAVTQFTAAEALGKPPAEVYGFYRNEYVRRNHYDIIRNTPASYVMLCHLSRHHQEHPRLVCDVVSS